MPADTTDGGTAPEANLPDEAVDASTPPVEPTAPTEAAEDDTASDPARKRAKTTRERAEERRQEKLDNVREQQETGSLVVRQMTEEERAKYPPRPPSDKPRGRRGR